MVKRSFCSVCQSAEQQILVQQQLELPAGRCIYDGYNIVNCKQCGFVYADSALDQETLDSHYAATTYRFANEVVQTSESAVDVERFRSCVSLLTPRIPKAAEIMDVGCGTGLLLSMFKELGFSCHGIDQSPVAVQSGIRKYGIPIETGSIFDLSITKEFDLVTTNHVLEHIVDLTGFLNRLWGLIKPDGLLYVEVPNAGDFLRFADPRTSDPWLYIKDLFTHFTPEHMNFFSQLSLRNLMTRYGFQEVYSDVTPLGVIASIWKRCEFVKDDFTNRVITDYDDASRQLQRPALDKIREVVNSQETIYVWGAGLHTQRLLTGDLRQAKILAFIDSDPCYHGGELMGKTIISPDLIEKGIPILISSFRAENRICDFARQKGIDNPLIRLYS